MTNRADISVAVEEITPQKAASWLEKNKGNRNIRRSRVDTYARDIRAGKWHLNGAPILFNGDGTLMDGQHRLIACVTSGKSFWSVVVRGISSQAHATIDVGAARSLGDELKFRGESYSNDLAAVLRLVWHYDNDANFATMPSRADLLRVLEKNPGIRDVIKQVGSRPTNIRVSRTALTTTAYILSREHSADAAEEFLLHLFAGTDYVPNDPCLVLRSYATKVAGQRLYRPQQVEWFAICIKTVNAWLLQRPLGVLKWARLKEPFPQMISKADLGE